MRFYKSGNLDPKARVVLTLQTDIVVLSLEPKEPGALELGAGACQLGGQDGQVAPRGPSMGETPLTHSLAGSSAGAEGLRSTKPGYGGTNTDSVTVDSLLKADSLARATPRVGVTFSPGGPEPSNEGSNK